MKHGIVLVASLVALSIPLLAGCGPVESAPVDRLDAPDGYPRTVIDGAGREFTLDAPPERILCFTEQCVIDLALIGVVPAGVYYDYNMGVAASPEIFGEAAAEIELVGDGELDFEAVAAWNPDVIMAWDDPAFDIVAPNFLYAGDRGRRTEEELAEQVFAVADLVGLRGEAERAVTYHRNRIAAYRALVPQDQATYLPVSVNIPETGGDFVWVPPSCRILEDFVDCVYDGPDWTQMTAETLVTLDPDLIAAEDFLGTVDEEIETFARVNDALWPEIRAAREGRFMAVPYLAARPETLLGLSIALDTLMPLLYPDVFPAPLTDEEVRQISAHRDAAADASGDGASLPESVYVVDRVPGFPEFADPLPMLEVIEDRGDTVLVGHRFGEIEVPKNPHRVFADPISLPTALLLGLNVTAAYYMPDMELLDNWDALSAGIVLEEASYNTNFEWVLSNEPDLNLVYSNVAWSDDPRSSYALHSAIAPTIVFGDDPSTYWIEAARALSRVLEVDDEALEVLDTAVPTIAEACAPLQAAIGDGSALVLRFTTSDRSTLIIGPGYTAGDRFVPLVDTVPNLFCGIPFPERLGALLNGGADAVATLSAELIPELDVDYLFISVLGDTDGVTHEDLLTSPLWDAVPAVRNGNVYVTPYVSGISYDLTLHALALYADLIGADRE